MSYQIINVASKSDLELIDEFVNVVRFNTKEDHIPLHDPLFSNSNFDHDIATYGDMTKEVVDIFEKYSIAIKEAVSKITGSDYDPPILGKSYILRHNPGKEVPMSYSGDRPARVYRSIVKWNDSHDGGIFKFKNYKISKDLKAGDCIIFPESEEFARGFSKVENRSMYVSDFWNAPVGQSPYPGLKYEEIYWGNPLWENR